MSKLRNPRKRQHGYKSIPKQFNPENEGLMCKATVGFNGVPNFKSAQLSNTDLQAIFEEDKRYGTFEPRNGKYFTFRVMNEDDEITSKQVQKSVQHAFRRISIRTHLKFRRARKGEYADFLW